MKPVKSMKLFAIDRSGRDRRTSALVTAGMAAALATVLSIIGLYLPVFSVVVLLLIPIPIAYLAVTQKFGWSVMVSFVVMLIDSMFFGVLSGAFACSTFCFLGLVLGYCYRQDYSAGKTLLLGSLAAFLTVILQLVAASLLMGMDTSFLYGNITPDMQQEMDSILSSFYSGDALNMAKEQSQHIMKTVLRALPFSFFLASVFDAWASMMLAKKVFHHLGAHWVPGFPPFEKWKFSPVIVYGYFVLIAIRFVMEGVFHYWPGLADTIMLNLSIAAMWFMWVAGLSVVWWSYHKKPSFKSFRWPVLILSLFIPLLQYGVAALGAWDMLTGYREKQNMG